MLQKLLQPQVLLMSGLNDMYKVIAYLQSSKGIS